MRSPHELCCKNKENRCNLWQNPVCEAPYANNARTRTPQFSVALSYFVKSACIVSAWHFAYQKILGKCSNAPAAIWVAMHTQNACNQQATLSLPSIHPLQEFWSTPIERTLDFLLMIAISSPRRTLLREIPWQCQCMPFVLALWSNFDVSQMWYADDDSVGGSLESLRSWWDSLINFGYFPNSSKTCLIMKPQHLRKARALFHGTGVVITDAGRCHLGSALNTDDFVKSYVQDKVSLRVRRWRNFLRLLSPSHMQHMRPSNIYFCIFGRILLRLYLCFLSFSVHLMMSWDFFLPALTGQPALIWFYWMRASCFACLPWETWCHCSGC